jgi:Tfp pilus assembly protein PilF
MPVNDHDAPGWDPSPRSRVSAAPPGSMAPPAIGDAGRDVANEDFLFHLYRGSELLQDNRMLEAKSELEHALTLQPRDPKGQDLLGVVYFRIGLYPHAIQIYENLLRENPRDYALRLNLALCYLKTGQALAARVELEAVVQNNPTHRRAWGYLGLAF